MMQVSSFECGGFTLGISVWHKLGDSAMISTFLKDWSVTAKGSNDSLTMTPYFIAAHDLFPQNESFPTELSMLDMCHPYFKTGKAVTRRFVFEAWALVALKDKSRTSRVQNPTRVEVVSALIWERSMAAISTANLGVKKSSILTHAMNLRRRAEPQLSVNLMGNLIGIAIAQNKGETATGLGQSVDKVREAITKINGDYMKKLQSDEGFSFYCESLKEMGEIFSTAASSEYFSFSSWCNFGFYEVDFGWGRPMWTTSSGPREEETSIFMNFIGLNENKWGDRIEAWVTLDEKDMAILECDKEFLAFASLDLSPLQLTNSCS